MQAIERVYKGGRLVLHYQKVADGNPGFLRSDRAFAKCMEIAHSKWRRVHRKLA